MELIAMSERDLQRIEVLSKVVAGRMTVVSAAPPPLRPDAGPYLCFRPMTAPAVRIKGQARHSRLSRR